MIDETKSAGKEREPLQRETKSIAKSFNGGLGFILVRKLAGQSVSPNKL
jgi:hypothetical protein